MGKVNDMETKETQMHAHTSCLAAVTLFESERFSSTPVKFDGPALLLNNITHQSKREWREGGGGHSPPLH
jgi:hypothetical protein